jgi:hypothetical protein
LHVFTGRPEALDIDTETIERLGRLVTLALGDAPAAAYVIDAAEGTVIWVPHAREPKAGAAERPF